MPGFSISLSADQHGPEGELLAQGTIRIGSFEEDFRSSLSYWNREQYLSQWRQALRRLQEGESRSALVTSKYDPKTANFIFWWVMYRIGDNVHIQNHCLFLSELTQPFDEEKLYEVIPERETTSEDGQAISEWVVKLSDIKEYLGSQL